MNNPRPDGNDKSRYENMTQWSYHRWAWEFLRRNVEYIHGCEQVEHGSPEEKLEFAKKFGLTTFKHYKESYRGPRRPKFANNVFSSWTNLDDQERPMRLPEKLDQGQVLVRFDLNPALIDIKSLNSQIRETEERLKKSLLEYKSLTEKSSKNLKPQVSHFGKYIRLLDAIATGKSNRECACLIWPSRTKGMGPKELNDFIRNPLAAAKEYASGKYMELSLLTGKPNAEKPIEA